MAYLANTMKYARKIVRLSVLTSLLGFSSFAIADGDRIYRSAHYLGRGDTGIAVAYDQEAIFYNPAGLAQGKGIYKKVVIGSPQLEFSSRGRDLYNKLYVQEKDQTETLKNEIGKPFHLGLSSLSAVVFRRAAVGALFSSEANLLVKKDPEQGALEQLNANFAANQALTFSLAEGFLNNKLLIGATGKYVKRNEGEIEAGIADAANVSDLSTSDVLVEGAGTGADLGMMLITPENRWHTKYSAGLTVKNVGDTKIENDSGEEVSRLKQTVNLGVAASLGTKLSRFKLLLDYWDLTGAVESNVLKNIHIGSEISVADVIGVTGGLNQGYSTAGIYTDIYVFRVDVGYYGQEIGERVGMYADERYFIRISAGI